MSHIPQILDGRIARAELKKALIERVAIFASADNSTRPRLVIIQVGNRDDSNYYIREKRKFAAEIGVDETHLQFPEDVTEDELLRAIDTANKDAGVQGIIVQLPLPVSIDKDIILGAILPNKDVDGLGAVNIQKWLEAREDAILPATVRGVRELLQFYNIPLVGKHVVMVGRSSLVGKPMAAMCLGENATVTICHSKTLDTASYTKEADILIVAIGKPNHIDASYVRKGQVVIDVGITSVEGKLIGDVDFDSVKDIVGAITPVPGGVGQMTVLALFENLIDATVGKVDVVE